MVEFRPVVFIVTQALACLYAARRGGKPERLTAAAMAVAAIATAILPFDPSISFHSPEWNEFGIDVALLVGLIVLMCRADRFWPTWMVAIQLFAVATHMIKIANPTLLPRTYSFVVGWLAYPMILLLVVGVRRHQKRSTTGREDDWSPLRW